MIVVLGLVWFVCLFGFIVNGPNHARVVQLFGEYVGTLTDVGFFYGNPFYATTRVSLRVRTFETGVVETPEMKDAAGKVTHPATKARRPSKVNDRDGTPIEIAAVVVWKVVNPAEAVFQVDDYEEFVHIQTDAALRNLASRYSYDGREEDGFSLRGHIDEVAAQLKRELQERLPGRGHRDHGGADQLPGVRPGDRGGDAPAAAGRGDHRGPGADRRRGGRHGRTRPGRAGRRRGWSSSTPERKAAMVSNLMVVLCGHTVPQPVLNTGTLYN